METRSASGLAFVHTKSPISTIELDIDSLPEPHQGWGEIVSRSLAQFALSHPTAKATIYTYFTQSVNFNTPTNSEFFGVAGSDKKPILKAIYEEFSAIPGVRVRYSDEIRAEHQKYHIEGGMAWEPEDAVTWRAIGVGREVETTSDDGWGELEVLSFLDNLDGAEECGWPPEPTIRVFNDAGLLLFERSEGELDLSASLMLGWWLPLRAVTLGVSTQANGWSWTEVRLQRMERQIKEELERDGYFVTTLRCISDDGVRSPGTSPPTLGTQEFRWALFITDYPQNPSPEATDEEAVDEEERSEEDGEDDWLSPIGESKVQRPRRIRGDALVGTTQSRIEKMLGIPHGSVALCKPDGSHWRANVKIGTLRKRWKD